MHPAQWPDPHFSKEEPDSKWRTPLLLHSSVSGHVPSCAESRRLGHVAEEHVNVGIAFIKTALNRGTHMLWRERTTRLLHEDTCGIRASCTTVRYTSPARPDKKSICTRRQPRWCRRASPLEGRTWPSSRSCPER